MLTSIFVSKTGGGVSPCVWSPQISCGNVGTKNSHSALPKGNILENLIKFLILISVVFDDFVNIFFLVPTSAAFQGTGSKKTE